jgi:glycosyltransferase involved in cell wall biosynthesis
MQARGPSTLSGSPARPQKTDDPRVLRVMTRLNVGGPARQALYLSREMESRGFRTRLVWGASEPGEGRFDPPDGIANSYLPWLHREVSPADDVRAYRAIASIIGRWRPRIVHTHLAKAGALGRVAAHRGGVPVVVHTFHGHVLQEYFTALKNSAFAAAERGLARWTDALIAVAPSVRDDLLARGIGQEDQWHIVPVGVDIEPLVRTRIRQRDARARLGLPLEGSIVGCVGRMVPIKDQAGFLEAARLVSEHRPDTTFVLAGDGQLREKLARQAREMLGDRVVFLGWVDDLPALYSAFDVVALTSKLEGTPVALIEASAAAKPVVATRVGGVREVVRDGNTGLLVAPGDVHALASNIAALLDDPSGARRMGREGRTWVRDRFAQERLADSLTDLYRELLARKGHRSPTRSEQPVPSSASAQRA